MDARIDPAEAYGIALGVSISVRSLKAAIQSQSLLFQSQMLLLGLSHVKGCRISTLTQTYCRMPMSFGTQGAMQKTPSDL